MKDYAVLKAELAKSKFRSRFQLKEEHRKLIAIKGWHTIAGQAEQIIRTRLAPAMPENDGKQTPMRGFPVFIAQHATGTCCRNCLWKWHGIPAGRPLTDEEIGYITDTLLHWMQDQAGDLSEYACQGELF